MRVITNEAGVRLKLPFRREEKAIGLTASSGVIGAALEQGWTPYPALGGGSNQRIVEAFNVAQGASYSWMYRKSPAVRTVIDLIVRNMGQLDLRLFEEVDEAERQPRPDHAAALSLRYPNQSTTGDGLVRALFTDYLIHDNAYGLLSPGPGDQILIQRIPAFMMEVRGSSLFEVNVYRVWPQGAWNNGQWSGSGTPIDITPDRIMHWHGEHPLDPRVGMSRLDTLRDVIAEDAALAQAIIELANNGLQAPIWVSRPLEAPEMGADTLRAHEEDIANRLRNRNRKPPVMMEGEQLQSFGMSPQDAQMIEVRRWAMLRVAAAYGVPPGKIGLEVNPDADNEFYRDTLPPVGSSFTRMLNQRILVQVYNEPTFCFEFDLDEKTGWAQLPMLISAAGAPIMMRDEARAKINLPPVPGGDKIITPANVIVGDNPLPSVGVMPIQDPNKPPQDGSYRTDQGPRPQSDYTASNGKATEVVGKERPAETKAQSAIKFPSYQPNRELDKNVQDRNIKRFETSIARYFSTFSGELEMKAVQRKADSRKAERDWARWTSGLQDRLMRLIREAVGSEGARYAKQFGGNFDLGKTQNYRAAMAQGSAEQMIQTVRQEVNDIGPEKATARLAQHAASAGGSLGVKATLFARREAARQSPDVDKRQETWVRDTDRHAALDGTSVPLGQEWPGGLKPGSSPGCRCTATIT